MVKNLKLLVKQDASSINGDIKSGYKASSIIGLSKTYKHPLPFYGEIYSSKVKDYKSDNTYTIKGLDIVTSYLKEYESVFVFDRGYDDNKFINYFENKHQYFVIRLKNQRKVIEKNKKIIKKEELDFEDFRVRSLNSINHIAFCLDIVVTFLTS